MSDWSGNGKKRCVAAALTALTVLAGGCNSLVQIRESEQMSEKQPFMVQNVPGYNSWPMIQNIKSVLVCAYSKGAEHRIEEDCRGVYARISGDGGKSWKEEVKICNSSDHGEVTVGKGIDRDGNMLLWVRRCKAWSSPMMLYHDLYRTADGVNWEKIASPELNPRPMQVTDVFYIPETQELMALWFAGDYRGGNNNSWGTLVSKDNGRNWEQRVVEDKLPKNMWPTEQSAIYLGNGRIIAIARRESVKGEAPELKVQFQLQSTDYGRSWSKKLTNIGDIRESTPSLLLTADGKICTYYYQRGAGLLKRRVVAADKIWDNPLTWPEPEVITTGSTHGCDAGHVNALSADGRHFITYYSGDRKDTAVLVFAADIP